MVKKELSSLQLFDNFREDQLAMLAPLFALCTYTKGESVFNQGDLAKQICIIVEGNIDICFKPDDGELITVARLERDGVFGWSAAFGSDIYTSGAIATTDVKILCITGADLKQMNEDHPKTGILVLERLARVVGQRLERTNAQGRDQVMAMLEHGLKNGIKPLGG